MAKQVTVNLFEVVKGEETPPLSDVITSFEGLPLDQRWRSDIRLDNINSDRVDNVRIIYLDFAKRREIGPGRLTENRPVGDILMAHDETFGEETAALYVPSRMWLLTLHNQAGIGPNRMVSYFNALDPGQVEYDFAARPMLDASVMRQLRRMRRISSVEVTATLDALAASEREIGTSMARAARPAAAQRVHFTLMANEPYKRGGILDGGVIKDLVAALRQQDPDDVTALRVKGEDPDLQKDVMIDLIRHRLKRRYGENELDVVNRRFTIESRWRLLARSFRSWNNTL